MGASEVSSCTLIEAKQASNVPSVSVAVLFDASQSCKNQTFRQADRGGKERARDPRAAHYIDHESICFITLFRVQHKHVKHRVRDQTSRSNIHIAQQQTKRNRQPTRPSNAPTTKHADTESLAYKVIVQRPSNLAPPTGDHATRSFLKL